VTDWIRMTRNGIEGKPLVERESFDKLWKSKGWREVKPEASTAPSAGKPRTRRKATKSEVTKSESTED